MELSRGVWEQSGPGSLTSVTRLQTSGIDMSRLLFVQRRRCLCEREQNRREEKKKKHGWVSKDEPLSPKGIAQRRLTFMEQKTFFY